MWKEALKGETGAYIGRDKVSNEKVLYASYPL